jgi:hypothetical protein
MVAMPALLLIQDVQIKWVAHLVYLVWDTPHAATHMCFWWDDALRTLMHNGVPHALGIYAMMALGLWWRQKQ